MTSVFPLNVFRSRFFFRKLKLFERVLVGVFSIFVVGAWTEAQENVDPNAANPTNSGSTNANPPTDATSTSDDGSWRDPTPLDSANSGTFTGPKIAPFSRELSQLPNESGQFWIVYNVASYSQQFPNVAKPQNAIVDWIMFDAGEDFWRKEPFSVFNATRDELYVYHNADVQGYVSKVVDRFLDSDKRNVAFSIKAIAVQTPDWRVRVASYLTPLETRSVGGGVDVQSWLVERANLPKILAELEKRSDFLLLNSVKNVVPNAERFGWASAAPKNEYVRDVRPDSSASAGYSSDVVSVDEGFRVEATPLLSTNGENLEALFRYQATVVEKMKAFDLRVATSTQPRLRLEVEKPSIVSCDVRVKVAFPRSKAAIVDLGMVPGTLPSKSNSSGVVGAISKFVAPQSAFYDVLILIEEAE